MQASATTARNARSTFRRTHRTASAIAALCRWSRKAGSHAGRWRPTSCAGFNMRTHAHDRAVERLGITPSENLGWWFPHLLKIIREGGAKCVQLGKNGTLAYDVPTNTEVYRGTVRVLVTPDRSFVITVLPRSSSTERVKQRRKQRCAVQGKRRQEFFKRIEDQDEL